MGQNSSTCSGGAIAGSIPCILLSQSSKVLISSIAKACQLIPPEILKPTRRQRRVAGGILDIAMPQVGLQRSGIDPVVASLNPPACRGGDGSSRQLGLNPHHRTNASLQLTRDPANALAGSKLGFDGCHLGDVGVLKRRATECDAFRLGARQT